MCQLDSIWRKKGFIVRREQRKTQSRAPVKRLLSLQARKQHLEQGPRIVKVILRTLTCHGRQVGQWKRAQNSLSVDACV
jgi:hypothetical protein